MRDAHGELQVGAVFMGRPSLTFLDLGTGYARTIERGRCVVIRGEGAWRRLVVVTITSN